MNKHSVCAFTFVIGVCFNAQVRAIGDGARAYWPIPKDTNILTPTYLGLQGNRGLDDALVTPKAEINTDILALQYSRSVAFGDHLGAFWVVLPGGKLEGGISNTPIQGDSSGPGDVMAYGAISLAGAPALGPEEFAGFTPRTMFDLMLGITAPTGEYNPDKTLNMGANRWSLRVGAPILHFFDWGPGHTTSLELVPSVTFFTDNDDPSGTASRLEQDIIVNVEAHLTHDFSKMLWGSIDALYTSGGETSIDGVDQDNSQRSLGLGLTVGAYFSKTTGISVSYGKIVDRNEVGMDGNVWRFSAKYLF